MTCGHAETIFGRRRYIPELRERNFNVRAFGERVAQNSPIQGSAADLIKRAMLRAAATFKDKGFRAAMLLQVHDELVFEAPRDELTQVEAAVVESMEGAATLSVPCSALQWPWSHPTARDPMQTINVNGYDMAYLDSAKAPAMARRWCASTARCPISGSGLSVLGPLTRKHRVIAPSLRHFFPDHWDGVGDTYSIAQHVDDVIGFIEKLDTRPVHLMGHSRGGHICFRVAQRRPDLLRKLILAEPGGELDATLDPAYKPGPSPLAVNDRGFRRGDRQG